MTVKDDSEPWSYLNTSIRQTELHLRRKLQISEWQIFT